ncbi:hypothetical protein RKD52_002739 [Metabacillus sp. SLBN-84]
MPTVVNLYCLKVNSISGNGSVTIGEAIHNSHTSNNKSQGLNSSYGDTSPAEALMENVYIDPDVNDQTDIANSDPISIGVPAQVPVPIPNPPVNGFPFPVPAMAGPGSNMDLPPEVYVPITKK